jgi:hypothetical protein
MEIEKPRLLDEYRGNKFFVGLSYTCRGRTAKCLTRNVQLEVMVDGQLPATLADGSLHGALFTFADKQQFQIGSPFEWTFSQCWKSGLREKCFPGSFTATVTASELNKIAVHKLPTSIAIAGVGELNVTFPVFRAVAANTQDKH